MKQNKEYLVIKDIPLYGGGKIKAGTSITRTHGVYYMDGGMLPKDYQQDFDALIDRESTSGWNYIQPIVKKTAFSNSKEEV